MISILDALRTDSQLIDRVCFLIDVRKVLFQYYDDSTLTNGIGPPLCRKDLEQLCLLLKYRCEVSGPALTFKIINTLLKLQDGILKNQPEHFCMPQEVNVYIDCIIDAIKLPLVDEKKSLVKVAEWKSISKQSKNCLNKSLAIRPVDLTFVMWEEPLALAYSYILLQKGLRPLSILDIKPRSGLRAGLRKVNQRLNQIFSSSASSSRVQQVPSIGDLCRLDLFDPTHGLDQFFRGDIPLKPSVSFKTLSAKSINSWHLVQAMASSLSNVLLFSGGGIVRKSTFNCISKKFLHIHPGVLPDVRGAHCIFWSILLAGFPSCSAMFLDPGIDTGEIIHSEDFELPRFRMEAVHRLKAAYTASTFFDIISASILNYYDPVLRAITLAGVLDTASIQDLDIARLTTQKQSNSLGTTYHFMHKRLRNKLIELLLVREGDQ